MKSRLVASLALIGVAALGTAGCTFVTPQVTPSIQTVSDGMNTTVGQVGIRNAVLIIGDGGQAANLVFTAVNNSSGPVTLSAQLLSDGSRMTETAPLPVGVTSFGKEDRIQFTGVELADGGVAQVFFQYGQETGSTVQVPVLNTDTNGFADYGPVVETTVVVEESTTVVTGG